MKKKKKKRRRNKEEEEEEEEEEDYTGQDDQRLGNREIKKITRYRVMKSILKKSTQTKDDKFANLVYPSIRFAIV